MHLRPLRLALHAAAATLLAGGGVLLAGAPSSAADVARPDSYGGDATASALHFMADRNPQPTPVSDVFHAELPYATTSLDSSGGASASAASLYPGGGILGAPALMCQFATQFCTAPIPRYPLIADASYPTHPDDQADSAPGTFEQGPLSIRPNVTVAHADPNRVEATTEAAGATVSGVLSADSATTHSKQVFNGGTLVVTAESVVTGLDIGGGALHIDGLRSVATASVNGSTVTSSSATTTITGATAGGVAVTIDSTGVHVAGQGDGGAAQGQVNTALATLKSAGINVRLLTPTKLAKSGAASAVTGGLLVTFAQTVSLPNPPPPPPPLPGAPVSANGNYSGSATLGGAGVAAFATSMSPVVLPPAGGQSGIAPPLATGSSQPAGFIASPLSAGGQSPVAAGPAAAPVVAGAAPATRRAAVGIDLTNKRLRILALVLLGYPAIVLLSAPLRAPARFPRAV